MSRPKAPKTPAPPPPAAPPPSIDQARESVEARDRARRRRGRAATLLAGTEAMSPGAAKLTLGGP